MAIARGKSRARAKRVRGGERRSSPESAAATPTPDPASPCTPLQAAFAIEYLVDRRADEAYKRATGGKRGKAFKQRGYELLQLSQVQARIAELEAEHAGDAARRKTIRIGALMRTALDPGVKTADRLRAIELSGKLDGDFVEKHEHGLTKSLEDILSESLGGTP